MHPLLLAVADRQLGVFTAHDAVRAGYSREEIAALLRAGRWRRLRWGVYVERVVVDHAAADPVQRHRLACMAVLVRVGAGPVVSHASAARLLDLPLPTGCPNDVRLTAELQWRRGRGYGITRAGLPEGDVTASGPIPLTTPARTLVDCGREWSTEDAVVAMDAALHGRQLTHRELTDAVLAGSHRIGIGNAARAAGLADARAESPLETLGRLRLLASGFPCPELQPEIRDRRGFVARVDAWYEDAAVAIEFDGLVKYERPFDGKTPARVVWEEKRREDRLRDAGIRVMRLARADVGADWGRARERLRELLSRTPTGPRRFTVVLTPPTLDAAPRAAATS